MQGFGGSPSSWQQADGTAQESLCLSCSTAASNVSFDYPAGCTCVHEQADIHTYVCRMSLSFTVWVPFPNISWFVFCWSLEQQVLSPSQQYSSEDAVPKHEEADRLQSFLWM